MNLQNYEGNHVIIKSKSGKAFTGLADFYSHADDNANGVASLTIETIDGALVEFDENEISNIKIISADVSFAEVFADIRNVV